MQSIRQKFQIADLKIALKDMEPYIKNSWYLIKGRKFSNFNMLAREAWANWLLCAYLSGIYGDEYTFQFSPDDTRVIFVVEGSIVTSGVVAHENDLIEYENREQSVRIRSEKNARLLVMVGEPLNEPVVGYGPFVMNSAEEIDQAFKDYKMGVMGIL